MQLLVDSLGAYLEKKINIGDKKTFHLPNSPSSFCYYVHFPVNFYFNFWSKIIWFN